MKSLKLLLFTGLAVISLNTFSSIKNQKVIELDRILVIANDQVITKSELNRRVKSIIYQLRQQRAQLPSMDILNKQILERLILDHLQLQLAERAGIRIDDETINNVISNIAAQNKLTLEQFREVLQKDNFDFSEFRNNIKNEMIINQLRKKQVENQIIVTEQEIKNQLEKNVNSSDTNVEYNISHILIAISESANNKDIDRVLKKSQKILNELNSGTDFSKIAISVSSGQNALQGGLLGWLKSGQLPELFSEHLSKMNINDLSGLIRSPSGFHILKLNDKRSKDEKHIVKQTLARHILIKTSQLVSNEAAREKLQRIRDRIADGEDFPKLAQTHSDDKASAIKGGSLGWVSPGVMIPRFEEEMNKLKKGDISETFRTQFGWHIVQTLARRELDNTKKFLHDQVRSQIKRRKVDEAVQNWLRQIRDEAFVEYKFDK
ncbi:Periplasmic chaperone and peptidyl-prolyl cis-trans isomerase of outer membrane proteins SurA [hydrothermal vent metagenome]|uniref:Periplasmic chaperone and peptidyl-prolyl cis-trans isomerase of outer membrane proteins SurA n=1 Tax=hydrothermal vent metagenome TaxID=652676 RepID=A0A3B1AB77_9ZZZZ